MIPSCMLQDPIEITPERRLQIVEELLRIDDAVTEYMVLDVAPTATRTEIQARYFALAKTFHPDTEFRKRMGHYRGLLEMICTRHARAYDVLGRARSRAAYDATLTPRRAP